MYIAPGDLANCASRRDLDGGFPMDAASQAIKDLEAVYAREREIVAAHPELAAARLDAPHAFWVRAHNAGFVSDAEYALAMASYGHDWFNDEA